MGLRNFRPRLPFRKWEVGFRQDAPKRGCLHSWSRDWKEQKKSRTGARATKQMCKEIDMAKDSTMTVYREYSKKKKFGGHGQIGNA